MGLDTTHDCWHGPYTAFTQWRAVIAQAIGVELMSMQGYGIGATVPWGTLGEDPIVTLLDHSDCDGEIVASDCTPLADRLEEILPSLTEPWVKSKAERFIAGLRLAASRGEPVGFH